MMYECLLVFTIKIYQSFTHAQKVSHVINSLQGCRQKSLLRAARLGSKNRKRGKNYNSNQR